MTSDSHSTHAPALPDCRNCGQDLRPVADAAYCPHCGQETVLHPPTFLEFVHEFVTHYVALEGALWRTLRLLLVRPGQLTREYFHGRRRHFVLPLRLYLTASFVFFLTLKLTGGWHEDDTPSTHAAAPAASHASATAEASASAPDAAASAASAASTASGARYRGPVVIQMDEDDEQVRARCEADAAQCGWVERMVSRMVERSHDSHYQANTQHRMLAMAPYAVFLMLPFFAALMKLCYADRRIPYGEHFVFSLHLHSFWFLVLLAATLLPQSLGAVISLAIPIYGLWAMQRVYGGRRWVTLLRAFPLSLLYVMVLGLAVGFLGLWAALAN